MTSNSPAWLDDALPRFALAGVTIILAFAVALACGSDDGGGDGTGDDIDRSICQNEIPPRRYFSI